MNIPSIFFSMFAGGWADKRGRKIIMALPFIGRLHNSNIVLTQAAVVHLNFRAGSTFPVPVCTVSTGHGENEIIY